MPDELLMITRVVAYSWFVPPFLVFLWADYRPRNRQAWITFLWAWLIGYVYIVWSVQALDEYIGWRVQGFDLNGDDVFSEEELQGEGGKWFGEMARDTARTFIPFTGVIFATLVLVAGYVLTLLRRGIGLLVRFARRKLV